MKILASLAVAAALLAFPAAAQTPDDVKHAPACKHCSMDREKFAASRMVVEYEDGTRTGVCSLHCAAIDLAVSLDGTPKTFWVADAGTKKLLDAEKAVWVLGGSRPGVMTKRAKWAFADRGAAEAFVKESGGTIVGFEDAMKAAYEDMYQDTKMIREKRKMMRAKSGAAPTKEPASKPAPSGH
jgi:nitrous oxide reductase accessory protein NosL